MIIETKQSLEEVFNNVQAEIRRAAVEKRHPFRFVALATQGDEQIGLRYVVLRKVTKELGLMIYTDVRTEKSQHIETNQGISLLFYDPAIKLQVKVEGRATLHYMDNIAAEEWKSVPIIGRRAYGPLVTPGSSISSPEEAHQWPKEIDARHFTVIHIEPQIIEALQLHGSEHLRAKFKHRQDGWKGRWIAP